MSTHSIHLVLTTFSSQEDAAEAVRKLVEEKLAACGTMFPGARSIYAWDGAVEDTQECVVILKTSFGRGDLLRARLAELHPYDNPEIVVIDPNAVSEPYLRWITAHCSP